MKISNYILTVVLIFISLSWCNAQSFMKGYGATISILSGPLNDGSAEPNKSYIMQTSFCYMPRYNLLEGDRTSLSIGAPVGAGIGIMRNLLDAGVYFAYELPAVLDYNFGVKSTPQNDSKFGGYFGAGYSLYHILSKSYYTEFKGLTYGPLVRAGIRMNPPAFKGECVTVGFFYKKGMEKNSLATFGCNVLLDL